MKKYEIGGYDIKEIQKVILEILVEVDRICKKNEIQYSLAFGTLLGAVRHKGFIPWDDDVDIMMTRDNYDRFKQACLKELDKSYFFMDPYTEKNYPYNFAKIVKENTIYLEKGFEYRGTHKGFFIDVFPMDNVNYSTYKLQSIVFSIFRRARWYAIDKSVMPKSEWKRSQTRKAAWFLAPIATVGARRLNKILEWIMHLHDSKDTDFVYPICYANRRFIYKRSWISSIKLMKFENYEFPCVEGWRKVLKKSYGDFMKYPPEKDQCPQHIIMEVKF